MKYEEFKKRLRVLQFGPDLMFGQHVYVLVKRLQPKIDPKTLNGLALCANDKEKTFEYLENIIKPLWK